VIPPRARPEFEMPSFAATTVRGCGPSRRSTCSHSGGSAVIAFSSSRVTTPSRNSAGAASSRMPSFFAAVSGFIDWDWLTLTP